jgi:hypothetical protein
MKLSLCLSATRWKPLGNRCIAPRVINLGTRWCWEVILTLRLLYPEERDPGTCWIKRSAWAPKAIWIRWRRRHFPIPLLELNHGRPAYSLSELSGLVSRERDDAWSVCLFNDAVLTYRLHNIVAIIYASHSGGPVFISRSGVFSVGIFLIFLSLSMIMGEPW